MPRQHRAAAGALGEQRRAVNRDVARDLRADQALEKRVLQPRSKKGIDLELLDLAILEARPLPAPTEHELLVATVSESS